MQTVCGVEIIHSTGSGSHGRLPAPPEDEGKSLTLWAGEKEQFWNKLLEGKLSERKKRV